MKSASQQLKYSYNGHNGNVWVKYCGQRDGRCQKWKKNI